MEDKIIVGEIITAKGDIILNEGRPQITVDVANEGDRPVQVGSHFHFFEVNRCLKFDRESTFGFRLDIPSGSSVRFEPGETKQVNLVLLAGNQKFYGLNNLTMGKSKDEALLNAKEKAFVDMEESL